MAPPAQSFSYQLGPSGSQVACTAAWDGTSKVTEAVTSSGAVFATYAGQCYANLNTPLPGWQLGNPT